MTLLKVARRGLLPPWLRFLNKSFRSHRKLQAVARDLGLPPLDPNPLGRGKSSDTLFVLGSGASVLGYSEEEWKTIAEHDSLGFNFWILHPFVPTHYMFELLKDAEDSVMECLLRNLEERADVISRSRIHVKDAERIEEEVVKRTMRALPAGGANPINIMWDADLPGETVDEFTRTLRSLNRTSCFAEGRFWAVPRNRATVFFAVNLAVRAGYRKIVLCGVDLNNTDYFFESEGYTGSPGLCIPPNLQAGANHHKTNDPAFGALTIGAILDIFDRIVLQPRGIELTVARDSSALYPRFRAYFPG